MLASLRDRQKLRNSTSPECGHDVTANSFFYTVFSSVTTISHHLRRVSVRLLIPAFDHHFELHGPGKNTRSEPVVPICGAEQIEMACRLRYTVRDAGSATCKSRLVETVVTELQTIETWQTAVAMQVMSSTLQHVLGTGCKWTRQLSSTL